MAWGKYDVASIADCSSRDTMCVMFGSAPVLVALDPARLRHGPLASSVCKLWVSAPIAKSLHQKGSLC